MAGRLDGKVAIITGGCSGMGRAATDLFIREGARVVVACIRDKGRSLEELYPGKLRFLQCDVRDTQALAEAVALVEENFGGLDIMYHNAGATGIPMNLEDMTEEEWDDTHALLLRSSVFAIKHAVPAFKRRGKGSIILTSSVGATNIAHIASIRLPAYAVAKNAVLSLGHVAALELARYRIRVNTIIPGGFGTSIFGVQAGVSGNVADHMAEHMETAFAQFQPLPQAGEVEDIAETALFLGSDAAKFITGVDMYVDGGLNLFRPQPASFLRDAIAGARTQAQREGGAD